MNRCYIVGYSDISAKYPHHRAASGLSRCEDPIHIDLYFTALVGGPGASDQHVDVTSDYIYNEVTTTIMHIWVLVQVFTDTLASFYGGYT